MEKEKWLKNWKVIDLLKLVNEIAGGGGNKHPVHKEWEYCVEEHSKGNDKGYIEQLKNNNIPIITKYLIDRGFKEDDIVMFWVCW